MLNIPLHSIARRIRYATPRFSRIAAVALFATVALHASAAGARAVKSHVAPIYPDLARHLRIEGTVVIEVAVDPDGKVTDVKPISGSNALTQAAVDAVRKWTFVPAPEKSKESVEIKFALAQ